VTRASPPTESRPPSDHVAYLAKAIEFNETARQSLEEGRYNSAGLEAIHAVISACDSLTVFHLGLRARGQDHTELLELLGLDRLGVVDKLRLQVSSVLSIKNSVEYGGEGLGSKDTARVVSQSTRVVKWASENVGRR
jgi:HEPN domain-containing protein